MECPNDINGMIDAAKFADLVLLLIDGSYGFEMVRPSKQIIIFKMFEKMRWCESGTGMILCRNLHVDNCFKSHAKVL